MPPECGQDRSLDEAALALRRGFPDPGGVFTRGVHSAPDGASG